MKKILALLLTLVMIFSVVACKNEEPENTTAPEVTTKAPDDDKTPTDFEVEIPTASELIAGIIGAISASVEITEGTEFVYVYESIDYPESSYKNAILFDIAEATVNSTGETINAQLTLRIGVADVAPDATISTNDVEYHELNVSVNGENISVTVDGQKQEVPGTLSDLLYGAVAQMMGLSGAEELQKVVESAYIMQELEKNLLLIAEQALGSLAGNVPTISPEYSAHLEELFAELGADLLTVTTDGETGNTTYSLNLAALKDVFANIEDKTLAEYLEEVFGENVIDELSSFLANLPDKKVKDIVDAAVALAEAADVDVQEIYALIDLYVETSTGTEFDIEAQINERYNSTLLDLLVEFGNVPADQKDAVKAAFAQAAQGIKTITIDQLLSGLFMSTDEGFFNTVKAGIDMLAKQFSYTITVDANGNLVALNLVIGEFEYSLTVDVDGTTTTIEADLRDAENDLLDYSIVIENEVITAADIVIRGYDVEVHQETIPVEPGIEKEPEITTTKTLVTFLTVDFDNLGEDGMVLNLSSSGNTIQISQSGNVVELVVKEGEDVIASATLTIIESGLSLVVNDATEQLFQVTLTAGAEGNAQVLTVDFDIDRLPVSNSEYGMGYIQFNGAIKIKIG